MLSDVRICEAVCACWTGLVWPVTMDLQERKQHRAVMCKYSKFRVKSPTGDRKNVLRKFKLAEVHTRKTDCQLVNLFLGKRSRYAIV